MLAYILIENRLQQTVISFYNNSWLDATKLKLLIKTRRKSLMKFVNRRVVLNQKRAVDK